MRIAIINEWWGAGAARCAQDLHHGLAAAGHEVCFLPSNASGDVDALRKAISAHKPDIISLHSFYGHRALPYPDLAWLSHLAPTTLTVHDPRPVGSVELACWSCARYRSCAGCPLVPRWRRLLPVFNRYYRSRLRKRLTHLRCSRDLRLIAPSDWMRKRLQGTELSRFAVVRIPNGLNNTSVFKPDTPPHPFRTLLPQGTPVVLHAAHQAGLSVNERKGMLDTWIAFRDFVLPRFPSARFAVAGEGLAPNHPAVLPLGAFESSEMVRVFSASDLYVTATRGDNLPYTVMEAMACGLPVVATETGGMVDLVRNGVTGRLVPVGAHEALGRAINAYLGSLEMRREHGRSGARLIAEQFTLERMIESYMNLFGRMRDARDHASNGRNVP